MVYIGLLQQPNYRSTKFYKMAYVDFGYSAFEQSDEFLHPETGCVLTLQYGQANVRHYQGSTFQDTRPVLRKPEDFLFHIRHPAGYSWEDYASGPEEMEKIIGLPKRDNPWTRWVVRGYVVGNVGQIAIGTLDELRLHWNALLPTVAPAGIPAHQPPPAGTRAQAARASIIQARINQGRAAGAQVPAVDQNMVARQTLGGPGTAFDRTNPGLRLPQSAPQQGQGMNLGAPQSHQTQQQHGQAAVTHPPQHAQSQQNQQQNQQQSQP